MSAVIKSSEHMEQTAVFEWAAWNEHKYPELKLMYHIPNGGSRNIIEAANLKRQGVKAGMPDICLPVARGAYHGLYIELKRQKGGRVTPEQEKKIDDLREEEYAACVCYGAKEAIDVITDYLKGAKWETFQQDLCEWVAWKHTTNRTEASKNE